MFHEPLLARRVAEQGNDGMLVERGKSEFGHVVFRPADVPTAFVDLVKWVKLGIKPAS
jgi:hypothetical protein